GRRNKTVLSFFQKSNMSPIYCLILNFSILQVNAVIIKTKKMSSKKMNLNVKFPKNIVYSYNGCLNRYSA
ncbi:hypothetical protein BV372_07765, partial [Nostoc sp. T09]|uniref:hypothetical protein n=1 Tax=Nostoc sp. T09 TaxID=1932621 RepID=UPI000B74B9F5